MNWENKDAHGLKTQGGPGGYGKFFQKFLFGVPYLVKNVKVWSLIFGYYWICILKFFENFLEGVQFPTPALPYPPYVQMCKGSHFQRNKSDQKPKSEIPSRTRLGKNNENFFIEIRSIQKTRLLFKMGFKFFFRFSWNNFQNFESKF